MTLILMGTNRLEGDREGEMVAVVRMRVPEQKDMDGVCDVSREARVVDYKSLRECLEVVELPILLNWTRRGDRPKGNAGILSIYGMCSCRPVVSK